MSDELLLVCEDPESQQAGEIAGRLQARLLNEIDWRQKELPKFVLILDDRGLALQQTGKKAPGPIRAEFVSGAVAHRRKFGGGKGQMIAKAVGVKSGVVLSVFDATAGLGRDSFVLATLGCQVSMMERSSVVAELLSDGLARAAQSLDPELLSIVSRMHLMRGQSANYLSTVAEPDSVDVVYLDPMFPERSKSASVKKEMAAFHLLVGKDPDADELLSAALSVARYRVVVKRPAKAPFLADTKPTYQLEGKTSRYDIYVNQKIP